MFPAALAQGRNYSGPGLDGSVVDREGWGLLSGKGQSSSSVARSSGDVTRTSRKKSDLSHTQVFLVPGWMLVSCKRF